MVVEGFAAGLAFAEDGDLFGLEPSFKILFAIWIRGMRFTPMVLAASWWRLDYAIASFGMRVCVDFVEDF